MINIYGLVGHPVSWPPNSLRALVRRGLKGAGFFSARPLGPLVLFLSIGLMSCQSEPPPQYGPKPEKEYATRVPQLQRITYRWQDTTLGYEMKVVYPAIRNDEAFNQLAQQKLGESREAFEAFIADFGRSNNQLFSEYETVQVSDSVVSVRQQYEWAVPGTSVLQYRYNNINYQPGTQEEITLGRLFREGVDYPVLLKEKLRQKMAAQYELEEVEMDARDLSTFIIGKDYLEFYKVLYPELMEPEPKAIRIPFAEMKEELAW